MTRGRFITLEGGEGTGKSTQTRRLAARLEALGIDVLATREPGGSPGGEEIRKLLVTGAPGRWQPITEALLHMASRSDHVATVIEPALAAGRWVVCDRFFDSTVVYQGIVQGVGEARVRALYSDIFGTFAPDLTLILDLEAKTGLARANENGREGRYEEMGEDFHKRVADAFRAIAAAEPDRCRLIDAVGTPDEVEDRLWREVSPLVETACA
ncbi:MAG: dTMP kinase [Sphingomonadales bacterium]|nr:dTMP kinase [Sphingomonadales bacterium]